MRHRCWMRMLLAFLLAGVFTFGVSCLPTSVSPVSCAMAQEEGVAEETGTAEDEAVENVPAPTFTETFSFSRHYGDGGFVSLWSWLLILALYLAWVYSTDWLSTDCIKYRMGTAKWVPIMYGTFLGGFLLFLLIPWYWLGIVILLAAYVAPLAVYIRLRNRDLSYGEQVFTIAHLRFVLSEVLARVGVKFAAEARDKHETGFPILLYPHGPSTEKNESNRIQARQHEGFTDAREMLSILMETQPEALKLDYTQASVSAQYQLDGVWNSSAALDYTKSTNGLQALKLLCGLNPADRKNRQEGDFRAVFEYEYTFPEDRLRVRILQEELDAVPEEDLVQVREAQAKLRVAKEEMRKPEKRKRDVVVHFTSAGVQGGERVLLHFEQGKRAIQSIDQVGMPEAMQEQLKGLLAANRGIFVFSAPPASGMRTTMTVALKKTDRYVREFYEIQDGVHKYDEVENITTEVCKSKELEVWRDTLRTIFLKDPNVLLMRDIPFPEVLDDVMEEMENEERFFITSIRAKDAAEALLRIMATKCDPKKWAQNVNAVLCQRLVRKLCGHCKESFVPSPTLVQQLGLKSGGHYTFYRTPTPKAPVAGRDPEEPCKECRALGYAGRTAVFELVVVGDETRKALLTQPKLEIVRAALKKDGNHFMMEQGLELVKSGVTSLQEIKRALS